MEILILGFLIFFASLFFSHLRRIDQGEESVPDSYTDLVGSFIFLQKQNENKKRNARKSRANRQ